MNVLEITIRTYKSLYDLTLKPTAFLVLAGPNNAGKSNTADALDFLGECHRFGLELALQRKGGYENVAHRRQRRSKKAISFSATATLTGAEVLPPGTRGPRKSRSKARYRVRHEFAVRARSRALGADYEVEFERLDMTLLPPDTQQLTLDVITQKAEVPQVSVIRRGREVRIEPAAAPDAHINPDSIEYPFNDPGFRQFLERQADASGLLLPVLKFNRVVNAFSEGLAQTRVYQVTPLQSRGSGVATPVADLERHGENLPTMVSAMKKNEKRAWSSVLAAMRRIIPGLETVDVTFTHDRRLTLEFREKGVGRPWTSEEVSDGTIQSLALFAAVYTSRSHLVVIEEPENSVHPWIVRTFVDICRGIPRKQLILTTHSPVVLSYLRPDEVAVVTRENGRTKIKPLIELEPDAQKMWESGKGSVFEILDSGLVRESIPRLAVSDTRSDERSP